MTRRAQDDKGGRGKTRENQGKPGRTREDQGGPGRTREDQGGPGKTIPFSVILKHPPVILSGAKNLLSKEGRGTPRRRSPSLSC